MVKEARQSVLVAESDTDFEWVNRWAAQRNGANAPLRDNLHRPSATIYRIPRVVPAASSLRDDRLDADELAFNRVAIEQAHDALLARLSVVKAPSIQAQVSRTPVLGRRLPGRLPAVLLSAVVCSMVLVGIGLAALFLSLIG